MIGLCIQIVRRHQYRQRLTFFSKNTNIFLIVGFLGCLLCEQNSEYKTSGRLSPPVLLGDSRPGSTLLLSYVAVLSASGGRTLRIRAGVYQFVHALFLSSPLDIVGYA